MFIEAIYKSLETQMTTEWIAAALTLPFCA